MRIPSHLLQAPLSHLGDEATAAFRRMGFGCLPLWTSSGCALFVHLDLASIKACRSAINDVRLELAVIDNCPLIRLDIRIYDQPGEPLMMDCFLNIQDERCGLAIEALVEQKWLVTHWYDEDLRYVRSSAIRWGQSQREGAKRIIANARKIVSETGSSDFDRAKAKYVVMNPL